MKKITLIFAIFLIGLLNAQNTQLAIVSTLHKAHQTNTSYTYDHLEKAIKDFKPNVLIVEVRQEDMKLPKDSLAKYYPKEMYEFLYKDSSIKYYGMDWYGDDIIGQPTPHRYFERENSIKNAQKKMNNDEAIVKAFQVLKPIIKAKNELVSKSTLNEMMGRTYDSLNKVYYEQIEVILKDTPHYVVSEFYTKRDLRMSERISEIVKQNSGKRIIVLTGADHRSGITENIEKEFGNKIKLVKKL